MSEREITSEERLLKLIRKKNGNESGVPEPHAESVQERSSPSEESKKVRFPAKFLKVVNLALLVLCVGLFGYFVYKYIQLKNETLVAASLLAGKIKQESEPIVKSSSTIKPFEAYAKDIDSRDLFLSPWEKEIPGAAAATGPGVDFGKDFKLIGIVLDDDPKAIIEDLRSNQTVFLSKGEKIADALVSEILGDKVILIYNEEKVELTP